MVNVHVSPAGALVIFWKKEQEVDHSFLNSLNNQVAAAQQQQSTLWVRLYLPRHGFKHFMVKAKLESLGFQEQEPGLLTWNKYK